MLLFSLYFYQEISQDSKVLTNATRNLFSSSNWQRSPIKRLPPSNLPARNAQTIPTLQTAARCQAPSSGGTTPTKGSHLLTQSSIKTWQLLQSTLIQNMLLLNVMKWFGHQSMLPLTQSTLYQDCTNAPGRFHPAMWTSSKAYKMNCFCSKLYRVSKA